MTFFVLGDEDVVLGFNFIGISGKIIDSIDSARQEFHHTTNGINGDIGVLLITEKVSRMIESELLSWQMEGQYPLVVEIPDLDGHLAGKKTLLESIREAIGLHV